MARRGSRPLFSVSGVVVIPVAGAGLRWMQWWRPTTGTIVVRRPPTTGTCWLSMGACSQTCPVI